MNREKNNYIEIAESGWYKQIESSGRLDEGAVNAIYEKVMQKKLKIKREAQRILATEKFAFKSLNDLIANIRKACEISAEDLSNMIQVNFEQYSFFEKYDSETTKIIDMTFLVKLLNFFNINISKIIRILQIEEILSGRRIEHNSYIPAESSLDDEFPTKSTEEFENNLRPPLSEFFYKLGNEIKKQNLEYLLK